MKYLTIFTPTYNRSNLLLHLYKSLCEQINKDFLWLIIDDGSKDNTKELVDIWKKENKNTIYISKKFRKTCGT
nr:glycosyltransferase family A protein [uncultured Megamonas sp.]